MLAAAERVFANKGFHEATISEIAKETGVSDATIYEYFSTKEELLFSIPGGTARWFQGNLEDHLKMLRGAANKLRGIIYHYLWLYETYPNYAAVAMLILKQNRRFLETDAYKSIRELSRPIIDVIEEGQSSGEFKEDVNPYMMRSVILGSIEHMVIRRVLLGKPEKLLEFVDPLIDLFYDGIKKTGKGQEWNLNVTVTPA
ncbi:TetR/AcrR family transcriptional regulator [Thermodesulfobacteriota bacterium]